MIFRLAIVFPGVYNMDIMHTVNRARPGRLVPALPRLIRRLAAIMMVLLVILPGACNSPAAETTAVPGKPRCVIVDQLSALYANPDFIRTNTAVLEAAGFEVEVVSGDAVTVGFWRSLPSRGYKLVILRVHAGLMGQPGRDSQIWLFSNEPYRRWRYWFAQLGDRLTGAKTREAESYKVFALSARYIRSLMRGQFADTLILNMGCTGFYTDEIARAFTGRGAAAYTAWDTSVGIYYVDTATTLLVEKIYGQGLSLAATTAQVTAEMGPDPEHGGTLRYYPEESGGRVFKGEAAQP